MYYDKVIRALNKNKRLRISCPYQRYKVLEEMWDLWFRIRKTLPERIIEFQDKFRRGEI